MGFNLSFYDLDGNLLATIERFTLREIDRESLERAQSLGLKAISTAVNSPQSDLLDQGLTNKEALAAFDQILSTNESNVVVGFADVDQRITEYDQFLDVQSSKPTVLSARPELPNAYVRPKSATEIKLVDIWQDLLALEQVGIHDDFFELGGHSLLLVQFHQKLQAQFTTKIAVADLYNHTTIAKLSIALTNEQQGHEDKSLSQASIRAEKKKNAMARRGRSRR